MTSRSEWETVLDAQVAQARRKFVADEADRLERRRAEEANCAADFREVGHDLHLPLCIFAQRGDAPCGRIYDPAPDGGDQVPDEADYAHTGIGLLYGYPVGGHDPTRLLLDLAGWTVRRPGALARDQREAAHWNRQHDLTEVEG